MEVDANQGKICHGATWEAIDALGPVYGYHNAMGAGPSADLNTENGAYRIGGDLIDNESGSTAPTSTSATSYAALGIPLGLTLNAGRYIILVSASARGTSNNQQMKYAIFNNGSIVGTSDRDFGFEADSLNEDKRGTLGSHAIVTVAADGQLVDVRAQTNTGTFNWFDRSIIAIKVHA